ncbi:MULTISPECIES: restriction endonuclease subunit S [Aeromonas]|uniref:restriction endonuclease subunit S n=1 Tax=Aeromonas TaxID=642 RepID=UPI000AED5067|nr:restriction endonuclease subunit S [Aeromonas caviae]
MAKQMMQDKASEMAATQTVPTGYQQTEVGVIPEDWDIKELQQICRVPITYGIVQCGPHIVNGIPYIRVSDMTARELDIDGMQRTSPQIAAAFARSTVDEGDIVYALRGKLGFVRSVPSSVAGANLTQGTARISPVSNVFGRYVFWALQSPRSLEQATQGAKGSTFVEITLASLKEIKIPVPRHKEEQKVIADALSDIDELIAGLEQLITKKQAIKTATMQQLLTGKSRLLGFSDGWCRQELKNLVSSPITDGPHTTPAFRMDGVPFLSVNNLVNNRINLSELRFISKEDDDVFAKKCKPQIGDVLLGKAASVGKVAIVDTDFDFNIWSPIALIRPNELIKPQFLYYQLLSADAIAQITLLTNSSSQGNIGMGDIEKIQISFPCIEEQSAIATILSDMDSELTALEQKLAKARDVKQGMMQQLLTGRIRLPLSKEA